MCFFGKIMVLCNSFKFMITTDSCINSKSQIQNRIMLLISESCLVKWKKNVECQNPFYTRNKNHDTGNCTTLAHFSTECQITWAFFLFRVGRKIREKKLGKLINRSSVENQKSQKRGKKCEKALLFLFKDCMLLLVMSIIYQIVCYISSKSCILYIFLNNKYILRHNIYLQRACFMCMFILQHSTPYNLIFLLLKCLLIIVIFVT